MRLTPGGTSGGPDGRSDGTGRGLDPLVVTLGLDPVASARFDADRRTWAPPRLQVIGAHLTLFHALPGDRLAEVVAAAGRAVAAHPPPELEVTGLVRLGSGVAWGIASPGLLALRAELAAAWRPVLTPQDRQPLRPHVTVQNKASRDDVERAWATLSAGERPPRPRATALQVWHYRGGPWERAEEVRWQG